MFEFITDLLNDIFNPKEVVYYEKIKIINPKDDLERIKKVLQKTDKNILMYVRSITVYDREEIPRHISANHDGAWGTVKTCFINYEINHSIIHVVSSKFRRNPDSGNKFELTLHHELGHVEGNIIFGCAETEEYAVDYSYKHV